LSESAKHFSKTPNDFSGTTDDFLPKQLISLPIFHSCSGKRAELEFPLSTSAALWVKGEGFFSFSVFHYPLSVINYLSALPLA
jgi:hypothetical protein